MSEFYSESDRDEFDGLAERTTDEKQIFRRFQRKSVAAREWIDDLIKNGYRAGEKRGRRAVAAEEGLFMSDEMPEVGVLSVAPALSALLFELSLLKDDKNVEKGGKTFADILTADKNRVLNVVVNSVCKLISECYPNGTGYLKSVLLSSMPFYDDSNAEGNNGWDRGGYLDTASWVFLVADSIESFLARLENEAPEAYNKLKWEVKDIGETLTTEQVKRAVREIYIACIEVTCDCIVRRDGQVVGWTFRKMGDDAEPSLYFSYVASTVYLGLYKRFNGSDNLIEKLRAFESGLKNSDRSEIKKLRFFEDITDARKRNIVIGSLERNGFTEFARFLNELDDSRLAELDLLYNRINKGNPLTYRLENDFGPEGSFTELKKASMDLAETLWTKGFGVGANKHPFRENMSKGPCFEDGTPVDMSVIKLSSHNNAFFNNLFVIGIVLNSAYDVELQTKKDGLAEYGKMLNAFQLSIQNTQRCYNEIESEGLLYKIDSYILDFSDRVDQDNVELAKQLRKVNMAVVPLMPLILKNNNLMSQYVIRYPQKEMTESLKDIIRNKKRKDGQSSWVWDKDGYNAITNYYYVDALISFYRYYESYEERFIANEEDKIRNEQKAVNAARADFERDFKKREAELIAAIKEKDEYIAEVKSLSRGIAKFVVNAVIDLVDEQLTPDNLIGSLGESKNYRDAVIEALRSKDKDTDTVKVSKLIRLLEKLQFLSLLSMRYDPDMSEVLKNGNPSRKDAPQLLIEDYLSKNGDISGFLSNIVKLFASRRSDKNDEHNN